MTRRLVLAALAFAVPAMGQEAAPFASGDRPRSEDGGPMAADPYRWLEEVESTQALSWVRARNAESLAELSADPRFEPFRSDIRSILNAADRIPAPIWRGGLVHNFWQDSSHVRGLWRSASLEEYRKSEPAWRVLLDMDKLGREEGESWVWKGAECLPPHARRCLVDLSRGGKDAYEVREFDLDAATFAAGGFRLPEAKHRLAWMDEESLLIGTDYGPGSLTLSGYPRVLKSWHRGEPLAGAPLVFEGKESDVSVEPMSFFRPEGTLVLISRSVTYFESEFHRVLPGGKVRRLALPLDAGIEDWFEGKLLVRLLKDWRVGKEVFKTGSLIAVPDDAYGEGDLAGRVELVYEPGLRSSLAGVWAVRGALYLLTRENVVSRLWAARRDDAVWMLKPVSLPADGTLGMAAGDSFRDELFASYESFLVPSTLHLLRTPGAAPELLKRLPARFDASGLESAQYEAVSADGTKVPYFLVSRKGMPKDGSTPVLLYGYGGFQIVYGPSYLQVPGKVWLEKGGAYALANIRGGGEFGPAWHQAALKEKRPRAFEDFIAVAEDIVARKVSEPRRLGIMGGSNGGLLVGAAMTRRPDLFGAVVCQVPLLDMMRYHKLLAGHSWMGEYGDPEGAEKEAIRAYSPYQNLMPGKDYPPAFFLTSTKDDRVHPGHARKAVARLLELGEHPLYYENIEGGHSAAADLEQRALRQSLEWVFLHRRLQP